MFRMIVHFKHMPRITEAHPNRGAAEAEAEAMIAAAGGGASGATLVWELAEYELGMSLRRKGGDCPPPEEPAPGNTKRTPLLSEGSPEEPAPEPAGKAAPPLPPGFRLATPDDLAGDKPRGTIYPRDGVWLAAGPDRGFSRTDTYAVPRVPLPEGYRTVLSDEKLQTRKPPSAMCPDYKGSWRPSVNDGRWDNLTHYVVPEGEKLPLRL